MNGSVPHVGGGATFVAVVPVVIGQALSLSLSPLVLRLFGPAGPVTNAQQQRHSYPPRKYGANPGVNAEDYQEQSQDDKRDA